MNVWGKGGFGVKGSYDYGIADAISIECRSWNLF